MRHKTFGRPTTTRINNTFGRPTTTRINNEMDKIVNKLKKYSYCKSEGNNRSSFPYQQ